jgi:hypothetical protein
MATRKYNEEDQTTSDSRVLRDLNSGKMIEIGNPDSFELETILINSAYYKYRGEEFRFLLCQARVSGLKIA